MKVVETVELMVAKTVVETELTKVATTAQAKVERMVD